MAGLDQEVDFLDSRVGHRIAADTDFIAVNHQVATGAMVVPVVAVGKAEIEGEVEIAFGVHRLPGDRVESFGRLAVALLQLWAEATAAPVGDRVAAKLLVGVARFGLDPEFEELLLFEYTDEGGGSVGEAVPGQLSFQAGFDPGADFGEAFIVGAVCEGE